MKAPQQVPRNALVWIIITMFALVAPHLGRIPVWILLLYGFTALWRVMVYTGRWSFPRIEAVVGHEVSHAIAPAS